MMKKQKKIVSFIFLFFMLLILMTTPVVFASNTINSLQKVDFSEEFKKWLALSDEEKKNVIMPKMYETEPVDIFSKNPFYKAKLLKSNQQSRYSLKDTIPTNLSIRNQRQTNSCWAFASLSSLETNLALTNYKKGNNSSKIYDFSERHMEYATSKTFANNTENKSGYNREVGSGGNWYYASSYLTNGSGAISESQMPFQNNENTINISEIQNKTVASQIYDTTEFEDYRTQSNDKKAETMNQIKHHIQNYGAVYASLHGNSSNASAFSCYNNDTGAKFCNNSFMHSADHAVSIIGWDDNYSIDNFAEKAKPKENGAWIIRNSWGEREEYKLSELKDEIFNAYKQECISQGWNSAQEIPNEFLEANGYTIENDIAYIKIGDNGLMYVSYEDCNIAKTLFGIVKSSDYVDYENIYQYDTYSPISLLSLRNSNMMLCNLFDKKTTGTEYLTQVSLYAPETYTCKVYVNPNGTSRAKSDMQLVALKSGESETISVGYHTLEFAKPIEIKANSFAVMVEIQGTKSYNIKLQLETKMDEEGFESWNSVTVENGKCLLAEGNDLSNCEWEDLGNLSKQNSSLVDGDSTLKAFTTSELYDNSLKNIEITTPPVKTNYFVGENFDKTGMVVKANYSSKTNPSVILDNSSYNITNGNNLKEGQTSVTITYEDKKIEQPIRVEKNTITNLKIKTPPSKTTYKEGQNFDSSGMIIEATFKDGSTRTISNYTIENGNNLKNNQTTVKISYDGKTVEQPISVTPNLLLEIKITKAPNKTKYIAGQNFDKTGMIVIGTYQDGSTQEILDYTIQNGNNLTKDQTSITIKFGEKTTTQAISVEEKTITQITIDKKPTKLTYIVNKEDLDLTGGTLKITYNDETIENVPISSEGVSVTGFDNTSLGKQQLTVTYQTKTTQFEIEIIEEVVAKNSDFDRIKCNIKKVQAYLNTNNSQSDYLLMNIEITDIIRNSDNDTVEYYYYLSPDKDAQKMNQWTKITEAQNASDKLVFTIDSRNIPNYDEIANEEVLYLYIKEVVIKSGTQSVAISKSMKLETDLKVEINTITGNNTSSNISNLKDNTIANKKLPQAGMAINIIIGIIILIGIGILLYIKYKNISKYVK